MIIRLLLIISAALTGSLPDSGYELITDINPNKPVFSGYIELDNDWEHEAYLSLIPTFQKMNAISSQMIISKAAIDSSGYFEFDLDFIPDQTRLYRIHVVRKGDNPVSLIIGGQNENHAFVLLNADLELVMNAPRASPPFSKATFSNNTENAQFQSIYERVQSVEKEASESTSSKRTLIYQQLSSDLISFMDSSRYALPILYAYHQFQNYSSYFSNDLTYSLSDTELLSGPYAKGLEVNSMSDESTKGVPFYWLLLLILPLGWLLWQRFSETDDSTSGYEDLSVQERKILELLKQGKSNQEIADDCNIALSTAKSHVSSIYSKLKIRSRKEVMDL